MTYFDQQNTQTRCTLWFQGLTSDKNLPFQKPDGLQEADKYSKQSKKKSDSVATKDFYTSFLCKEKSFLNPLCSSLQFVARTVSEDLKDFHGEVLLHN